MVEVLDEEALQQLYTWIDEIPLSRPKRNISRDFSDGVLVAEIVHHLIPKMIDLHNYSPANSTTQKLDNWNLLKRRCFSKLHYSIEDDHVKGTVACKPGVVEVVLTDLRHYIESYVARQKAASMVENNQIHDELSPDYQDRDATNPNFNDHNGTLPYTDPYAHAQNVINPPYQFQSQPHVIQDIHTDSLKEEQHLSPRQYSDAANHKSRKPVSQANKMKAKPITSKTLPNDVGVMRLALEEKEQALLASQETVQILQAKVRRLEHLLHLKDLRIEDFKNQQHSTQPVAPHQPPAQHQPPTQHQPPASHQPSSHTHSGPPQQLLINTQTKLLTHPQTYPINPTHIYTNKNQFPLHPPLPQIYRPHVDDGRKYQR